MTFDVSSLTPEQKLELARSMHSPLRCGGLDYDPDGTPVYLAGGRRITVVEWEALVVKTNER